MSFRTLNEDQTSDDFDLLLNFYIIPTNLSYYLQIKYGTRLIFLNFNVFYFQQNDLNHLKEKKNYAPLLHELNFVNHLKLVVKHVSYIIDQNNTFVEHNVHHQSLKFLYIIKIKLMLIHIKFVCDLNYQVIEEYLNIDKLPKKKKWEMKSKKFHN